MEAVKAALASLPQDSVVLRYLLAAANDITSSDVDLAAASGAIVLGFNVEPAEAVVADAKNRGETSCSARVPEPGTEQTCCHCPVEVLQAAAITRKLSGERGPASCSKHAGQT